MDSPNPAPNTAANGARGEVICPLGGQHRRLCLTLGALAQIEAAFGLDSWQALAERLGNLAAQDLIVVLQALLRGGGEEEAASKLPELAVDFREAAEAVARAFAAAGGE